MPEEERTQGKARTLKFVNLRTSSDCGATTLRRQSSKQNMLMTQNVVDQARSGVYVLNINIEQLAVGHHARDHAEGVLIDANENDY